jgi:hypothetical protein
MLLNLLASVFLAGLIAASLLVCLASWGVLQAWEVRRPSWLMKRCDFCAGYCLSVLLLLGFGAWHLPHLGLSRYWLALALPEGYQLRLCAKRWSGHCYKILIA